MKSIILAGAVLIAGLAACGGGSGGGTLPTVAAPTMAPQSFHPQAVGPAPTQGNGSPLPYAAITTPGYGTTQGTIDTGLTITLAAPVPVYNIGGAAVVSFEFVANTTGNPVATQVGTTSSYTDLDLSYGTMVHAPYVNGKTTIPCFIDAQGPIMVNGTLVIEQVDYLACAGNPFI